MTKAEKLVNYYNDLSDEEKMKFAELIRPHWIQYKLDNYKNPKTTKQDIKELQEKLVQTCIDFINEKELNDIDEVSFSADCLQSSAKYKEWTPFTDSFITVNGWEEYEEGRFVRKKIGDYC